MLEFHKNFGIQVQELVFVDEIIKAERWQSCGEKPYWSQTESCVTFVKLCKCYNSVSLSLKWDNTSMDLIVL